MAKTSQHRSHLSRNLPEVTKPSKIRASQMDWTVNAQTTGQLKRGMYDPHCGANVARAERARGTVVGAEFGKEARA